jgi:hypothetical protein
MKRTGEAFEEGVSLLQRAGFASDREARSAYTRCVADPTREPDCDAALRAPRD